MSPTLFLRSESMLCLKSAASADVSPEMSKRSNSMGTLTCYAGEADERRPSAPGSPPPTCRPAQLRATDLEDLLYTLSDLLADSISRDWTLKSALKLESGARGAH